jgi:hypothetical protein
MLIPEWLLACSFGQITLRAGNRQHNKRLAHVSYLSFEVSLLIFTPQWPRRSLYF